MFVSSIIKNVLISSKMNDDRKPRSDTNGEGESEVTETSTPQGEKLHGQEYCFQDFCNIQKHHEYFL